MNDQERHRCTIISLSNAFWVVLNPLLNPSNDSCDVFLEVIRAFGFELDDNFGLRENAHVSLLCEMRDARSSTHGIIFSRFGKHDLHDFTLVVFLNLLERVVAAAW